MAQYVRGEIVIKVEEFFSFNGIDVLRVTFFDKDGVWTKTKGAPAEPPWNKMLSFMRFSLGQTKGVREVFNGLLIIKFHGYSRIKVWQANTLAGSPGHL